MTTSTYRTTATKPAAVRSSEQSALAFRLMAHTLRAAGPADLTTPRRNVITEVWAEEVRRLEEQAEEFERDAEPTGYTYNEQGERVPFWTVR